MKLILIVALAASLAAPAQGVGKAQAGEAHPTAKSQQQEPATTQATSPSFGKNNPLGAEQSPDGKKKADKEKDADLDAQLSMADSAREQVNLTWWQNGLTAAEMVLLGITLFFTGWAAVAAASAAKSAKDAVSNDRAWIVSNGARVIPAENITLNDKPYKKGFLVYIDWKNSGRTPSLRGETVTDIAFGKVDEPNIPTFVPKWPEVRQSNATAGPDMTFNSPPLFIVGDAYAEFVAKRYRAFAYAIVRYRDIYNPDELRISEVCFDIFLSGAETDVETGRQRDRFQIRSIGPQNTAT